MSCLYSFTHTIHVNETRLSSDIVSSEIAIQNFQLFRLDRNCHGGGVAIYTHPSLHAIPLHLNDSLPLLLLSERLHECTFTFGAHTHLSYWLNLYHRACLCSILCPCVSFGLTTYILLQSQKDLDGNIPSLSTPFKKV